MTGDFGWEKGNAWGQDYWYNPRTEEYQNQFGLIISRERAERMNQEALRMWITQPPQHRAPKNPNDQGVIDFLVGWARELVVA